MTEANGSYKEISPAQLRPASVPFLRMLILTVQIG